MEVYIVVAIKKGWIRKSKSLAVLNILIAKKLDNLNGRPYIDFRELNKVTIKDKYPLPSIQYL